MDSIFALSNEEAILEDKTDMPVLQDMINDIRETTASDAQTSNTTLPGEDFLLEQALILPQLSESIQTTEDNQSVDGVDASYGNASESIVDGLISSGKRFSLALNNTIPSIIAQPETQSIDNTLTDQTSEQQIDNVQPFVAPTTASIAAPKKKQHIMISYNRSCEETCRTIRNKLKELKYKVWMDIFDMPDDIIDGMAKAIKNSYIVLMCINRKYDDAYWCQKEAKDVAIKQINFIPCFMEEPYSPEDWLAFIIGSNTRIDFSNIDKFDDSFKALIKQITIIEERLAINPRETPPVTPMSNTLTSITPSSTVETFDTIMGNFKTWVEANRNDLKRFNRKQSAQLITQLIQGLESDNTTPDNDNKTELLQQLLSLTTQNPNDRLPQMINSLSTSNYPMIKGLLFIMALWAVRVVFKKD